MIVCIYLFMLAINLKTLHCAPGGSRLDVNQNQNLSLNAAKDENIKSSEFNINAMDESAEGNVSNNIGEVEDNVMATASIDFEVKKVEALKAKIKVLEMYLTQIKNHAVSIQ